MSKMDDFRAKLEDFFDGQPIDIPSIDEYKEALTEYAANKKPLSYKKAVPVGAAIGAGLMIPPVIGAVLPGGPKASKIFGALLALSGGAAVGSGIGALSAVASKNTTERLKDYLHDPESYNNKAYLRNKYLDEVSKIPYYKGKHNKR